MWIMTTFGFFSVVEKPWDREKGTLTVRARVREDIDSLRDRFLPELTDMTESGNADYRFRAQVPRQALAAAMSRIVGDVDYDNFKNAVAREQGHRRAGVYGSVWANLSGL